MPQRTLEPEILNQWLGKTESHEDVITAHQANLMCATLGKEYPLKEGDELPPLWHWLYFLTALPPSELGRDGHPKLGGFLPPVALPRRMWAGGKFDFINPILIGDTVEKVSTIESIKVKNGRSGKLCFVTVSHTITANGKTCLREEHDIVYREEPKRYALVKVPLQAPKEPDWQKKIKLDPVTLFRYSALTFNGHRIHYDRLYCREVEGYPDLIVHGPLVGTMIAEFAVQSAVIKRMRKFSFQALNPIFDNETFYIEGSAKGESNSYWARKSDGSLAMRASAKFIE